MKNLCPFFVFILVSVPAVGRAENWDHWRGPQGNGNAPEASPPLRWTETENVKWKVPIPGRGSGSPVVWGDQVFVVTAVATKAENTKDTASTETDRTSTNPRDSRRGRRGRRATAISELEFKLLCIDRSTGELRWEQTACVATPHEGAHATNSFASASPCTDGKHVYAHFGSRGLFCFSMDGKLVWKRDDLGQMRCRAGFGEGSSPTLVDEKILVPWDHEGQSYLFALNKNNGQTIWKIERDEPTGWATPLVVEHDGRQQVIMNGQNFARAYDLATGEELWRCAGQTQRPVASPVAGDELVFVGSGFRGAFLGAFRLDGQGDIEGTEHVVWTIERDTPDIASLLLSNGRIYFYKGKSGVLSCVESQTGEPLYKAKRVPGLRSIYASPVAAGGRVYLTGRSGTTVVIEDADEFVVLATNSVGETVDATPAAVDKELFIRGENHLFCIE
ncbi:MAG: PQQ-binding-like beta-propeller repeat protein [Planctomycetaceae bacterium]|nr:PQQ-binding-like beta-propeller repeat protein [Planctomycetaceae bacterium]